MTYSNRIFVAAAGWLTALMLLAPASAFAKNILIYGPAMQAVAPNEKTIAEESGHTVTVVDAETWSGMTTAQFSAFNAIVFGDPHCSTSPGTVLAAAVANRETWSAAVSGNIILNGTDPIDHFSEQGAPGAHGLIKNGINFAASGAGPGLYVSLSCYYFEAAPGTVVDLMGAFGAFTVEGQSGMVEEPDGGPQTVVIVQPGHPAMAGLTNSILSNWHYSIHEAFTAFPENFVVLAEHGPTKKPYVIATVGPPPTVTAISPNTILQFEAGVIEVTGTFFERGATVDFGPGIQVESVEFVSDTKLKASVQALPSNACSDDIILLASLGFSSVPKKVKVTNPDGRFAEAELLTLVGDSDGDGVPNDFGGAQDNCECVVNPSQEVSEPGVGLACADITRDFITGDQTVPGSGTPFVVNESVFVSTRATFAPDTTPYAFFPLAPWNVLHRVRDITPGHEKELEPRIFEVGISLDDVQIQDGTGDITSELVEKLTDQYSFESGHTYEIETFAESRVKGELPDQHCATATCPPIKAYRIDVPTRQFTFTGEVPNVDGTIALDPQFWNLSWETTPTSGVLHVFYGNLTTPGFAVTNIAVSTVRLFGTLQPTGSAILPSKTGFTGQVLDLTFNKTDAIKALRAWVGHPLFNGDEELVVLTGRFTSNGQNTGTVIGVFTDETKVTIQVAGDQLNDLIAKVQASNIANSLKNSLLAKLFDARDALQKGQNSRACGKLNDFINQVQAQKGKGIPPTDADIWINDATRISKDLLQC